MARSPIANDTTERVYFTGDGVPKMTFSPDASSGGGTDYPTVSFNLGVPAPSAALTATLLVYTGVITGASQTDPVVIDDVGHGLADGDQIFIEDVLGMVEINDRTFNITYIDADSFSLTGEAGDLGHTVYISGGTWTQTYDAADVRSRAYVYTYVSASGEEGPPSPVSNIVDVGFGQQVDLSGMSVGPAGSYDIQDKFIYRAEDGDYQFTGEVVLAVTIFADTVEEADLGEILPSTEWLAPPTDMIGMIMLKNGIGAGFTGKDLYLSEPYQPHAYPERYRQTTDYAIVAIAGVGTDIIVATEGTPEAVTAYDPGTASSNKIEFEGTGACVSKRSMVDMGNIAMWAAPDGIAAVGAGFAKIITRGLLDPDDWKAFTPSSIHAYRWRGRYVGFYDTGVVQGGFIFDPRQGEENWILLDDYATAGYYDEVVGDLYLQIGDDIVLFNGGTASLDQTWKGGLHRVTSASFSVGKVEANGYPVTLSLISDSVTRHTETVADGEPFRMPNNYLADEHEILLGGYIATELVTDGSFASACGVTWTCGSNWTISGGLASHTSGFSSTIDVTPVEALIEGVTYTFVFTLSNHTSGNVRPRFGGGTAVSGTARSSDGTYSEDLIANANHTLITLSASNSFAGSVTVLSVKLKVYTEKTITASTVATSTSELKRALGI